jgi:hypothetical protein
MTTHFSRAYAAARACPVTGLAAPPPSPLLAQDALETACDAPCPVAGSGARLVADLCPEAPERLALCVFRYLAAARETREADCVDAAFAEAEAALPPEEAGLLVGALGGLVRAFATEMGREPATLPASCCRATADEAGLVALLARARAGASLPESRLARTARAVARLLEAAAAPAAAQ